MLWSREDAGVAPSPRGAVASVSLAVGGCLKRKSDVLEFGSQGYSERIGLSWSVPETMTLK